MVQTLLLADESDELEAALKAQRKASPAPTTPTATTAAGRAAAAAAGETGEDGASSMVGGGGGVQEERTRGEVPLLPPKDPLGRMLWALCQAPYERSQVRTSHANPHPASHMLDTARLC